MRRAFFLSTALILAASSASADEVANSTTMSCAAVAALVQQRGQVVFETGGGDLSRVVANPSLCSASDGGAPIWIPSQDQSQCLAGYRCVEREGHGN
ncbi:hypothetical protein KHC23_15340 [Ancylobacter dichloromethanicus]|uniref:Uncharacterized protein n=1 Tax=Ancylobacter dichloromethanicus TaxID=518825 RepID=A0A9W6JAF5_9HYPH|nr:hypothetical protein [Ancylobacter dichloromethanicus]MBS7555021.1 hypothetical protein [Ancylobacter dichloromethanicus]GLK72230.1 hypothetical protein GCM10017643_23460 [Ancylobacter dichloromethanicus]